jgi:hypothetical protein
MSERDVIANQKRILQNQKAIIANQSQIKANQDTIKKNQATILKNQGSLGTIIKNQKQILAAAAEVIFCAAQFFPARKRKGPCVATALVFYAPRRAFASLLLTLLVLSHY